MNNKMTELTKRKASIKRVDSPHYYKVNIVDHPNGIPQICCGSERDAVAFCEKYPGSTWEKIYLPHPPQTIDVPHVKVAPDLELPAQQILPESELQEFSV